MIASIKASIFSLVLGIATFGANAAQAYGLYQFTVTWQDGAVSEGRVTIDLDNPRIDVTDNSSAFSYRQREWQFVDFFLAHRGRTYSLADLYGGYINQYEFPVTSAYYPVYGSAVNYLYAEIWNDGKPLVAIHRVDIASRSRSDYGPSVDYAYGVKALDSNWVGPVLLNPPDDGEPVPGGGAAIPEPMTVAGLALAGAGLLAYQRQRYPKL
ncbi:MAG: PEP-CTERM sorting domain-containing protein [Cyanobacteria bacterium]|nr:PEP-CTERM sorting domain-containing protein [Cyanobacteriota bacterium]MDW8200813.1 PEP-CTERM sorting domain-containing protein [Cyanobacteriota bacterium SKYGB_h_bin112]